MSRKLFLSALVLSLLAMMTMLDTGLTRAVAQQAPPAGGKAEKKPPAAGARAVPRYRPPAGYYVAVDVPSFQAIERAFRSTAIHQLLEDPSVGKLIEKIEKRHDAKWKAIEAMRALARDLDVEETVEEHMQTVFRTLTGVRPERIRVYFYRSMLELKKAEGQKKPEDHKVAVMAGVVLRAEDVDPVKKALGAAEKFLVEKKHLEKTKPRWVFQDQVVSFFVRGEKKDPELEDVEDVWYFWADRELYFGINSEFRLRTLAEGPDKELEEAASKVTGPGGVAVGTVVVDTARILADAKLDAGEKERERTQGILQALGVAGLKRAVFGLSIEGLHWRQTVLLEMPEKPTGLLGALLAPAGSGKRDERWLPAPPPRLLEVKGNLDIAGLVAAVKKIEALGGEEEAEEELVEEEEVEEEEVEEGKKKGEPVPIVQGEKKSKPEEKGAKEDDLFGVKVADFAAALDGSYTFTLSAPTQSVLPPRMALKIGVADAAKLEALIDRLKKTLTGIDFQERTYREVKITSVQITNSPVPLQPSFARIDDALYASESRKTLRSIIEALKSEGESAPVAKAAGREAPAAFPGEVADARVDLRFDTGEVFRMMNEYYLPVIQFMLEQGMRSNTTRRRPLLGFAEMPDTATVIRYLGPGRGGVAWSPGGLTATAASPIGEPFTAAAMTVYPSLSIWSWGLGLDAGVAELEKKVCHRRLRKIREALKLYRASFGGGKRYPSHLGALLTRALVEDADVFRIPSDEDPRVVEYENEDGEMEEIRVSYKFLPDSKLTVRARDLRGWSIDVRGFGFGGPSGRMPGKRELDPGDGTTKEEKTILLYQLNACRHGGRFVLCTDGSVYVLSEERFRKVVGLK